MKYHLCHIIGDVEFIRLMLRQALLFIFGKITYESAIAGVNWLVQGGMEFEYFLEKYKDIPCEITFKYINHAHECMYD